jgi:hypothetical protein
MGWKAILKAIQAVERRQQRDAQKRLRELERRSKEQTKLFESSRLTVDRSSVWITTFSLVATPGCFLHTFSVSRFVPEFEDGTRWPPSLFFSASMIGANSF